MSQTETRTEREPFINEELYQAALNEIYARVESDYEGLEDRILKPVLLAALGYIGDTGITTPTADMATHNVYAILYRLREDLELAEDDEFEITWDAQDNHHIVSYRNSEGVPYRLDAYNETVTRVDHSVSGRNLELVRDAVDSIEIHGDMDLSVQELLRTGLGPERSVILDESTEIALSKVYMYRGRKAVVGYVTKYNAEGAAQTTARTFYQSGSQGIWRYLPSHNNMAWYNKGHGEDSLAVPAEIQAEIADLDNEPTLYPSNAERIFFGTARSTNYEPGITYTVEVERDAYPLHAAESGSGREFRYGDITEPENLLFDESDGDAPDYQAEPVLSWVGKTTFESQVRFEVVPSKNGAFKYVFANTPDNRAWLAYVEDNSEVQSVGVREKWIQPGNFSMPIVEYASQSGNYGVYKPGLGARYVDMWDNYLSKAPFLQDYLSSRRNR